MNDQIDRLFQQISLAPDTIWVLIADHGEAFEDNAAKVLMDCSCMEETMAILDYQPILLFQRPRYRYTQFGRRCSEHRS